jgi:hypothetical protein
MTGEDDEIDWAAFDHVVLQVFEEQEDRSGVLTYPLTSQRQALDFIKLMNRKGLPFQQMCDTIGEKPETFRSWRLGNGNSHVGNAMMRRINRTIQARIFNTAAFNTLYNVMMILFLLMSLWETLAQTTPRGQNIETSTTVNPL